MAAALRRHVPMAQGRVLLPSGAMQGAKVGILDFDAHYGDGTDHILRLVPELGIKHHTFGRHYPCGKRANGWKTWLLKALADLSRERSKVQTELDTAEAAWVQAEEALVEAS